jgi:hypothetical protein
MPGNRGPGPGSPEPPGAPSATRGPRAPGNGPRRTSRDRVGPRRTSRDRVGPRRTSRDWGVQRRDFLGAPAMTNIATSRPWVRAPSTSSWFGRPARATPRTPQQCCHTLRSAFGIRRRRRSARCAPVTARAGTPAALLRGRSPAQPSWRAAVRPGAQG